MSKKRQEILNQSADAAEGSTSPLRPQSSQDSAEEGDGELWFEVRVDEALQSLLKFVNKATPALRKGLGQLKTNDQRSQELKIVLEELNHGVSRLLELGGVERRDLSAQNEQLREERTALIRDLSAARLAHEDLSRQHQEAVQQLGLLTSLSASIEHLRASVARLVERGTTEQKELLGQNEKLSEERDALSRHLDAVRLAHDELNSRHQEAVRQLALKDREGKFVSARATVPQHDNLVSAFLKVKQQHVERLALDLFRSRESNMSGRLNPEQRRYQARIKHYLTRVIFASDATRDSAEVLTQRVLAEISLEQTAKFADPAKLAICVNEGLRLMRDMAAGRPPGLLFVVAPGESFDPERHELTRGCPDQGDLIVEFTVYPGYEIQSPAKVLVKAKVSTQQVETSLADEGAHASETRRDEEEKPPLWL